MRVVVTGATGNVGTSLLELMVGDSRVRSIVGVARRRPLVAYPMVDWREAHVGVSDLAPVMDGADAVIHLAWLIQPSHDEATLWKTNVLGSRRVLESAAAAGVGTFIYASSIGAYSAAVDRIPVDEAWPVEGIPTSFYSRHKAEVEWLLDGFEETHPEVRVVRFRPALIFKRHAASGVRKLFLGRLIPRSAMRPGLIPRFPVAPALTFQAVHTDDVAAAFNAALHSETQGPFNLHSEPMLSMSDVAEILDAKPVRVGASVIRGAAVGSTWGSRFR
jgi:UDP-glucose 4-epimerase